MDGYGLFRKGRLGWQGRESPFQSESSEDAWTSASGQVRVNREHVGHDQRAEQHG